MKSRDQIRAFAMIGVLLITTLIGLSAVSTFAMIYHATRNIQGELVARRLRSRAIQGVVDKIPDVSGGSERKFECLSREISQGSGIFEQTLCAHFFPGGSGRIEEPVIEGSFQMLPAIDFNLIFKRFDPADCNPWKWSEALPSGFKLSPGSAVSGRICTFFPTTRVADIRISGNALFPAPFVLSADPSGGVAVLAATGFLDIAGAVKTHSDLMIIAGGDLCLKGIVSGGTGRFRVTLISATGSVNVEQADEALDIKALGRERVSIPSGYNPLHHHRLLPPLLHLLPVSLG